MNSKLEPREVGFSTPIPLNTGVWRHVWLIEHEGPALQELPSLPPPAPDEIEGPPQVLLAGILQSEAGRLRLEVFTPYRWLNGPEVGLVIRVLWSLQDLLGPLRLDGHANHPILRAAELSKLAEASHAAAMRAGQRKASGRQAPPT